MPFAVALLCHPAGAYGFFMVAVVALVHAGHARTFLPSFTGLSAAALSLLAFAHSAPDATGLSLIALAVLLLHAEFLLPTYGAALALGLAAGIAGSWLLLAGAAPDGWIVLSAPLRAALSTAGTLTLLGAVVRGMRLRTLGR